MADDSAATPEGVASVAEANNRFAIDFYKEITKTEEGNVLFSPWSLESALSMTYEGARGRTAEEMQSVLHVPEDADVRRPAFARLMNLLNPSGKQYILATANALWAREDFPFLNEYLDAMTAHYLARIENMDFNDAERSSQIINAWVEERTYGRIKDLISPDVLRLAATQLVLTNAVYFKGNWATQFEEGKTQEADFTVSPGDVVKAQMMTMYGKRFNYTEAAGVQIVELPYEGGDLSMVILLPNGSIDELEASLDNDMLNEWLSRLYEPEISTLSIPKLKFETKYSLNDALSAMGMPTAFSSDADLSGMDGLGGLFISAVIHQTFLVVNEEGTEAAAATAVVGTVEFEPIPLLFIADHPFIFLIRENDTGLILFMGRVMDPTKG